MAQLSAKYTLCRNGPAVRIYDRLLLLKQEALAHRGARLEPVANPRRTSCEPDVGRSPAPPSSLQCKAQTPGASFFPESHFPQITGIVVGVFLYFMERDRRRLPRGSRHILRRQRENEGRGIGRPRAVDQAELAANVTRCVEEFELRHASSSVFFLHARSALRASLSTFDDPRQPVLSRRRQLTLDRARGKPSYQCHMWMGSPITSRQKYIVLSIRP
jgi:hypothetical protein